jgi:hypothetical protein
MRKAMIAIGVALALLLVAVATVWILELHGRNPVNAANLGRIHPGMIQEEVAAIFGGPPVDVGLALSPGNTLKRWHGDDGIATIEFDRDDRVVDADYRRVERPLIPRMLALLGL